MTDPINKHKSTLSVVPISILVFARFPAQSHSDLFSSIRRPSSIVLLLKAPIRDPNPNPNHPMATVAYLHFPWEECRFCTLTGCIWEKPIQSSTMRQEICQVAQHIFCLQFTQSIPHISRPLRVAFVRKIIRTFDQVTLNDEIHMLPGLCS